jgi:phage gp36-like protein
MPYAVKADLEDRFSAQEILQLLDRDGNGVEDPGVLDKVLADTDAEIDAYLRTRYTLPLNPVPTVIVRLAAEIARYRLWSNNASEEVRNRYKDAIKFLTSVSQGEVQLGANTPAAGGLVKGGSILADESPERVFGRVKGGGLP